MRAILFVLTPSSHTEEEMNIPWVHRSLIAVASLVVIGVMLLAPARIRAAAGCMLGSDCAVWVCGQMVACGYCNNWGDEPCGCDDWDTGLRFFCGQVCVDLIN